MSEFGALVPTIAFSRSIDQGRMLVEEFNSKGYDFRQVHSGDNEDVRRRHIADFRNGECIGLVSVAVLAEGFDVRDVQCVLNARPTVSLTRLVQIIGRGQRACPDIGKKHCIVIDMTQSIENAHGDLCAHWSRGPQALEHEDDPKAPKKPPLKKCPQCGLLVALGTKTCPTCGHQWPANVVDEECGELKRLERPDYSRFTLEELSTLVMQMVSQRGRGWAWALCVALAEAQVGRLSPNVYRVACAKWLTMEHSGVLAGIPGPKWHAKTLPKQRPSAAALDAALAFDSRQWYQMRANYNFKLQNAAG